MNSHLVFFVSHFERTWDRLLLSYKREAGPHILTAIAELGTEQFSEFSAKVSWDIR